MTTELCLLCGGSGKLRGPVVYHATLEEGAVRKPTERERLLRGRSDNYRERWFEAVAELDTVKKERDELLAKLASLRDFVKAALERAGGSKP